MTPQSPNLDSESLGYATETAKRMLKVYPDYSKSPPDYLAAIVSILSTYPRHTQNRLADLKTGIPGKCTYLPTVADIVKLAESYESARPSHTFYKKFEPDNFKEEPLDHRKRVVMETLGYNPQDRKGRGMEPEYAMPLNPDVVAAVEASYEAAQSRKRSA